jgi:predicted nucleic acid-binding protein
MATLTIQQCEIFVPARTMLLDSCVLIGAYHPEDQYHEDAMDFMLQDEPFLVPYVVLGEAWGMLVGSRKRLEYGIKMINSLRERPNTQFVPVWSDLLNKSRDLCAKHRIDLVDASLMCLSSFLRKTLKLKSPIPIATYDTRDFCRCHSALPFGCFDMKERSLL